MRTIPTELTPDERAKQSLQATHYNIVNHGQWGFEVQPPLAPPHNKPVVFNQHKRDPRHNWHAALNYARAQSWATPLHDSRPTMLEHALATAGGEA